MKIILTQKYPFNSYELLKSRTGKFYIRHNSQIQGDYDGKTIELTEDEMEFADQTAGSLEFMISLAEGNRRRIYSKGKKVL